MMKSSSYKMSLLHVLHYKPKLIAHPQDIASLAAIIVPELCICIGSNTLFLTSQLGKTITGATSSIAVNATVL
jgi:hypothetical protein